MARPTPLQACRGAPCTISPRRRPFFEPPCRPRWTWKHDPKRLAHPCVSRSSESSWACMRDSTREVVRLSRRCIDDRASADLRQLLNLRYVLRLDPKITGHFANREPLVVVVAQNHADERHTEVAHGFARHVALHILRLLQLALTCLPVFLDVLRPLCDVEVVRR